VKSFDPVKKFWPGENVFIKCSHLDVNKQGTLFKVSHFDLKSYQPIPRRDSISWPLISQAEMIPLNQAATAQIQSLIDSLDTNKLFWL
jgi:hypothetical protein